jgi:hypothetical protein
MKRLFACLFFLIVMASVASARWDNYVQLTTDNNNHGSTEVVMDDSLQIHAFFTTHRPPAMGVLLYQRFDHWGHALCQPESLLYDSMAEEYHPGVLIDRQQKIHLLWNRTYLSPPGHRTAYYARMNTNGEYITGPIELQRPDPLWYSWDEPSMVQDSTGIVWASWNGFYLRINEDGDILTPLSRIIADSTQDSFFGGLLSASPDGHVWACARIESNPLYTGIVRMDTTERIPVSICTSCNWFPPAFVIDTMGGFHAILGNDDGPFYWHDRRDGSPSDTIHFALTPHGAGETRFTLVGDTFQWIRIEDSQGFTRVGFNLNGHQVLGPQLVRNPGFLLNYPSSYIWKNGSYWLFGGVIIDGYSQVCMVHVPGQNEPPDAVDERTPAIPLSEFMLYPNPTNGGLSVQGPIESVKALSVYNVLGQQVMSLPIPRGSNGMLSLPQIDALSTGAYFLKLQTRNGETVRKFVIAR